MILTPHLRQITNYPVVSQFLRDGNLETNGWVGKRRAVSMANQYDQQVESDMRGLQTFPKMVDLPLIFRLAYGRSITELPVCRRAEPRL